MSSEADARFAESRRATLRARRRTPFSVKIAMLVAGILAVIVTVSAQRDRGRLGRDAAAVVASLTLDNQRAGTQCAGWPVRLAPTSAPDVESSTVALWGERDAFHLRNDRDSRVSVGVSAGNGELEVVAGDGEQVGEKSLRFDLAPGAEGSFTLECRASSLAAELLEANEPAQGGAFHLGNGKAASPLVVSKRLPS